MMHGPMKIKCWAVFKRQAIKLRDWYIWLVDLFEYMMMHGHTNPKFILYHWKKDQTDKNISQETAIWTAFDCPNCFHLRTVDLFIEEMIYSIHFLFITSARFKWQICRPVISNRTEWLRCHFLNTPVFSEITPYRLGIRYSPFGGICFLYIQGCRRNTALRNGCII